MKQETNPREFLRARESSYVSACARFLQSNTAEDPVWYWEDAEKTLLALLIYSKGSFFPVFNGQSHIPVPHFMSHFLSTMSIYALQGLLHDTELLEAVMGPLGYVPVERIDYDLMSLDQQPNPALLTRGPPGLILRPPKPGDMDNLFQLQSAYDQEEVLPQQAVFNPAACRLSLEHIMDHEHILVAELGSRLVGKINTSAASFSRYQIGGVYVHPAYRGLGIASRMGALFIRRLLAEKKGVTLFVKKQNPFARKLYRHIGFETLNTYRISYF